MKRPAFLDEPEVVRETEALEADWREAEQEAYDALRDTRTVEYERGVA